MAGHICIRNFPSKSLKESGGQTENRKIKEVNSELGKVGEGGARLELKNIRVYKCFFFSAKWPVGRRGGRGLS